MMSAEYPALRATPPTDDMKELFRLCRLIENEYSGASPHPSPNDYEAKRQKLDSEFAALCGHLIAMAMGQLGCRSAASPTAGLADERRARAIRAISLLFNLERKRPRFAIVGIIQRFFKEEPNTNPIDLFSRLSGVVAISLRNTSKAEALEGDSLYAFTSRHVNDCLAKQQCYRRIGRWISIDSAGDGNDKSRAIMCRDLVALGSNPGDAFRTPTRIAFDILETCRSLATREFWLNIGELRQAVYEIYRCQIERLPLWGGRSNPEEEYAQNELCAIASSTVSDAAQEYGWKASHAIETRTAFERAALDKLQDSILLSDRGESNFGYLARHVPGLTAETFNREYKGSFQHFWLTVTRKWKIIHAKQ